MSVEADIQKILKIKKEIYSAILGRGVPPKDLPPESYFELYPAVLSSIETESIDDTNGVLIKSNRLPEPLNAFGGGIAYETNKPCGKDAHEIPEYNFATNALPLSATAIGHCLISNQSNFKFSAEYFVPEYETSNYSMPSNIKEYWDEPQLINS